MEIIYACIMAMFGAVFGSFAGAVAWRIHQGRDFVKERSECEYCHHILGVNDLWPIASWLFLKGKCRYCKKPIGKKTLAIEVLMALAFAASYLLWPYGFATVLTVILFALWLVILVLFALLFVYDARWSYLPDKLVWPLIVLSLLFFVVRVFDVGQTFNDALPDLLYSLAPIAGVYGLIYLISRGEWIGLGDVKLGIALGLLLGWDKALLALILANFIGFFAVLPALIQKKLQKTAHIPFGPFLIVAGVTAFLLGDMLIKWYVSSVLGV